jgi:hypothetical protein
MRVSSCTVRFFDRQKKEHLVQVEAASVYEAACRAWAIFKTTDEQTREESYKTDDFVVEAGKKTYRVNLEKLLTYLDRGRKGRDDTPKKKRLRRLKDADIWGTVEACEKPCSPLSLGGNRLFRKISIQSVQKWAELPNVLTDHVPMEQKGFDAKTITPRPTRSCVRRRFWPAMFVHLGSPRLETTSRPETFCP